MSLWENTITLSWRPITNFMAHKLAMLSTQNWKFIQIRNSRFLIYCQILWQVEVLNFSNFFSKIISEVIKTFLAGYHHARHIPWTKLGHSSSMSSIYLFRIGWIGLYIGHIWDQPERGYKVCVLLNLRVNWILLTQRLSDPLLGCLRSFWPHDSQPRVDHVQFLLL